MNTALKIVTNNDLASRLVNYVSLNEQIKDMEAILKNLRTEIETDIKTMGLGDKFEHDGFKVSLSEQSREVFNTKEAKATLGEDVIGQFIKMTQYSVLRVTDVRASKAGSNS